MEPTYLTGLRINERGEVVPETTTLEALKMRLSSEYGTFSHQRVAKKKRQAAGASPLLQRLIRNVT